jgi:anti-sigma factor RsiW
MSRNEHPDIETLEKFLMGKLDEREFETVRRHLRTCALCGLELKRLQRFATIDSDEDLSRSAEWIYARRKLENVFAEKIAPAAPCDPHARKRRASGAIRAARWLVPAAVAAAGLIIVAIVARHETVTVREPARRVMRGAPPARYGIELVEPSGEIRATPAVFKWKSERDDSRFTLEIFTPALASVYRAENIAGSSWTPPDTLATILKPNIIYLWSVKGIKGLERVDASPNGWFTIVRRSAAFQSTP